MSGIKKFSELSKEELIKRMSRACCYKCETFVEFNNHWTCQGCECVCCDSCVEEGDVDNEELEEDCGFICEECRPNFKKEEEYCEEHEQPDGLKCSACIESESEEEAEEKFALEQKILNISFQYK